MPSAEAPKASLSSAMRLRSRVDKERTVSRPSRASKAAHARAENQSDVVVSDLQVTGKIDGANVTFTLSFNPPPPENRRAPPFRRTASIPTLDSNGR